ncbi:MAG: queuosine salvage family protein [Actinomycetota bacterium]|nr:queuosine salvage family protein [Actinomycetota bacterium]
MSLCEDVRATCAAIAARPRWVTIDADALERVAAGEPPALDPVSHFLEGEADVRAAYILTLDAVNFGSGWFPTLRKRPGRSGYFTVAGGLAARFRAHGPWTNAQLRAMRTDEIADVLDQPRDHELMSLYADALRELGRWMGERSATAVIAQAGGSAERLATELGYGMARWRDVGFFKRAQIAASDLDLAGVAAFDDLDRLTIFADNLVPHVLRVDGVLRLDARLAAHIDAGRLLRPGPQERELRACAVRACELIAARLGLPERELDAMLWTRGHEPRYRALPRHRCRSVFY